VEIITPETDEQIEKGEQLLQSLCWSVSEPCSVHALASHLSKMEQGTSALNKIYRDNM
jgi:hypothetical protein